MATYKIWGISIGVGAVILFGLLYWYQWSARALSEDEIEFYLSAIAAQT